MTIPLLRHGSFSSHVRDLQTALNAALSPSPNLIIDGVFGGQTYAAVRRFQTERRIDPDGGGRSHHPMRATGRAAWFADDPQHPPDPPTHTADLLGRRHGDAEELHPRRDHRRDPPI